MAHPVLGTPARRRPPEPGRQRSSGVLSAVEAQPSSPATFPCTSRIVSAVAICCASRDTSASSSSTLFWRGKRGPAVSASGLQRALTPRVPRRRQMGAVQTLHRRIRPTSQGSEHWSASPSLPISEGWAVVSIAARHRTALPRAQRRPTRDRRTPRRPPVSDRRSGIGQDLQHCPSCAEPAAAGEGAAQADRALYFHSESCLRDA